MFCAMMISSIFLIGISNNVSAPTIAIEEWVAIYNSPENYIDGAVALVTDSLGNVYITGGSRGIRKHYDIVTIKYDTDGNKQWEVRYDGPANDWDSGMDIAIDSMSNIYVTGRSRGRGTSSDYVTIAYDKSGNELWLARYNSPFNDADEPCAITLDSSRNVYVTGYSIGAESGLDYATVKYDSLGNELWVARYNGPGNLTDRPWALAVDPSGNVYVTGDSVGYPSNWTSSDYATVAYDSSGNELWVSRYNGPTSSWDRGCDIVLDSSENIYVTGMSLNRGANTGDYCTIAYDSFGNERWVVRYNGPGNFYDGASAITYDPLGRIYVTGTSFGDNKTQQDYATIAYDSLGKELWVKRYNGLGNGNDRPRDILLDEFGNIYVTGTTAQYPYHINNHYDITTVKYDSFGNEIWVNNHGFVNYEGGRVYGLGLDLFGNVYITGTAASGISHRDCITIKYSQHFYLDTIIDIDPDTLNLKSRGRWITCYITLYDPYYVNDIDISTILIEDTLPVEWGDIQGDTLMVKFDRSEVEDMLSPGTYNLKVTGELADGTSFEGYSDEIRVIDPGK
jgi:hypothetical protein